MKILSVEASSNTCSVALLVDGVITEKLDVKKRTQLMLPMVDALLKEEHLRLNDLTAFAFGRGPGSFTGLRIAAGTIQGFAFSTNLPAVPISSLQSLAQGAFEDLKVEKLLVGLDAKMGEIYWGAYQLGDNGLMQEVEKDSLGKKNQIPDEYKTWQKAGDAWDDAYKCFPRAYHVSKLAVKYFKQNKVIKDPSEILPIYLRGEDAWKTKDQQ